MPQPLWLWLTSQEAADLAVRVDSNAQAHLIRALRERRIEVQAVIDESDQDYGGQLVRDGNIGVPPDLRLEDIDFTNSRPLRPWPVGPMPGEHYTNFASWKPRVIKRLDWSRADVEDVFGIAGQPVTAAQQPAPGPEPPQFAPGATAKAAPAASRRHGPRPVERERVKARMLKDIQTGKFTVPQLRDMTEEAMSAEYEAGRDTCRAAREETPAARHGYCGS